MMIKFNEPFKSKNTIKYLEKVVNQNSYTNNFFKDGVTEYLSEKFGYKNFLLTHSATAALEIAAMLCKQNGVKRAILPSYTFSSTANAFLRANIKLKFSEIQKSDLNIDLKKVKQNKTTDVLCLVHYANSSADMGNRHIVDNNILIEDAAQSFNVKYDNKLLGTFGKYGCISFHPTKNVHSGFGGMFISKSKSDLEIAKFIYERGTDRSKVTSGLKNKYEWVQEGSSFEMTELSAAVLLSSLENYDHIYRIRKEIYSSYANGLKELINLGHFSIQKVHDKLSPNYHAFYILLKKDRSKFINHMQKNGIESYIGYVPLHNSKYGKFLKVDQNLPLTEKYSKLIVRLPLHTGLRKKDVKKIIEKIHLFFK
jgi:dTDP-4-amino-4,6-dideoxygalactose transaminase